MSKPSGVCWELVLMIALSSGHVLKVFVVGDTSTPRVNLPTTKRKPLAFVCCSKGFSF